MRSGGASRQGSEGRPECRGESGTRHWAGRTGRQREGLVYSSVNLPDSQPIGQCSGVDSQIYIPCPFFEDFFQMYLSDTNFHIF